MSTMSAEKNTQGTFATYYKVESEDAPFMIAAALIPSIAVIDLVVAIATYLGFFAQHRLTDTVVIHGLDATSHLMAATAVAGLLVLTNRHVNKKVILIEMVIGLVSLAVAYALYAEVFSHLA